MCEGVAVFDVSPCQIWRTRRSVPHGVFSEVHFETMSMPLLVTPSFPFASSSSHCSRWPFHPIRSLPSLFHLLLCPPQRRFAISACLVGHSLPWRGVGGPCLGLHLSCNDAAHCRTIGCSRSGGTWDPCQRNGSHRLPPLLSLSFSPLHDFPSQQTKPAFAARVCKQLQLQSGTWTWLSAESRFSNSHPPPLTLPPTKNALRLYTPKVYLDHAKQRMHPMPGPSFVACAFGQMH